MANSYDPLTVAGLVQQWATAKPDFCVATVEGAGVRDDETRTYQQLWDSGHHLAAGLLGHDLHSSLCLFQLLVAEVRKLHAFFIEHQGLIEGKFRIL